MASPAVPNHKCGFKPGEELLCYTCSAAAATCTGPRSKPMGVNRAQNQREFRKLFDASLETENGTDEQRHAAWKYLGAFDDAKRVDQWEQTQAQLSSQNRFGDRGHNLILFSFSNGNFHITNSKAFSGPFYAILIRKLLSQIFNNGFCLIALRLTVLIKFHESYLLDPRIQFMGSLTA